MSSNDICTILVDELFKRDKTYLEKSIAGLNDQQLSYVYRGLATLHFSNVQKFENYFTTMCEGIKDATSKEINFFKLIISIIYMKIYESIKSFFLKCKRVWFSMKKPSRKEYETIAKVSGIGILILGAMGFLISIIMKLFFQ